MDPHLGWLALPLGLALGLLPPRCLYPEGCRHLTLLEARSTRIHRSGAASTGRRQRRWWKLAVFWLDPLRGYAAASLLALGLGRLGGAHPLPPPLLLLLHAAALGLILAVQMHAGRQKPGQLLAPVAFLLGLTAGFRPDLLVVGAAVGLLGLATMFAAHSFTWGCLAAGAAALALGLPFLGPSPSLLLLAFVAASPAVAAFLRRATLVIPLRA